MSGPQTPHRGSGRELDAVTIDAASILSGLLVWGGVGWLLDRWLGFSALFLPIGAVVGVVAATFLVIKRHAPSDEG